MVTLDVKPLVMKDVDLTFEAAGDDYRKHCSGVVFTPTANAVTWTGLGENTHTDQSTATWAVAITYVQDWESADSLSRFLYEHEGERVPMTFRPKSGAGASFTADVFVTPGAIGGPVNAFAETTATLGCDGRPKLVPAA